MFIAAVVQLNCTSDREANWEAASCHINRAADRGAKLIATPENSNFLGPHEDKVRLAESLDGPTCARFSQLAAGRGVWLLLGSFNEKSPEPGRCYNTSVLFGPDGAVVATYRKIHLFDVDLRDGVCFSESETVAPGNAPVVAETGLGPVGLSICYDLRFGELYRRLGARGAAMLAVPSAFTMKTGRDHWQVLLRARAIENQCYVLAPAQFGVHDDRGLRESYGRSMIVDPWGQVLAVAPDGPGIAAAEIDLDRVDDIRRAMPMHLHRRPGLE